jgi:hypothetical protein
MTLFDFWVRAPVPRKTRPTADLATGGKKNIDKPSRVKAFCEKLFASGCSIMRHLWCLAYQSDRLV